MIAGAAGPAFGLPRVERHAVLASTMDRAHALAGAGAPDGTLVVASEQTAGRGRHGRPWASAAGAGVWLTLLARPRHADGLPVLSLRAGLTLAAALEPMAGEAVRLKWPNDLFVGAGKLAGVLVEARWRGDALDWVALGVGINLRLPSGEPQKSPVPGARGALDAPGTSRFPGAALRAGVVVDDVLEAVAPRLWEVAQARGPLTPEECRRWAARDLLHGRRLIAPVDGVAQGIAADGTLQVETARGVVPLREASVVLADPLPG